MDLLCRPATVARYGPSAAAALDVRTSGYGGQVESDQRSPYECRSAT